MPDFFQNLSFIGLIQTTWVCLAADEATVADGVFGKVLRGLDRGTGLFKGGLKEERDGVGQADSFCLREHFVRMRGFRKVEASEPKLNSRSLSVLAHARTRFGWM